MTISKNLAIMKKSTNQLKKSLQNTYQQIEDSNKKIKKKTIIIYYKQGR